MSLEEELLDPFRKKKKFENAMDDFFAPIKMPEHGIRAPLVDILDRGKTVQVVAELPGIDKKDIDIEVTDGSIAIKTSANSEFTQAKKNRGYYFHERKYAGFFRQLPLPSAVIANRAKADFKDGILKVEIPKKAMQKEKPKSTRIRLR
ncbi:MAG: Hsp20/alpha crystallin family protein [Candidatus ainarchaeum sp.]|nr:Hsp20/alpha crystallin family protein [Candidatus ainarchaeum sp.]